MAVGTANPEVSMSAPMPSPSMEPPVGATRRAAMDSSLRRAQRAVIVGTQPYSAATPAFTPLASPMTNPSPGPMQSHGSSSTPAKPVTALSIDEELSLKLGQTMKVLDNCMYLVQNFQGDQNDAMTKAVQSYVQRLGELHAYIQKNMPTSHMIPRSIMTWLDQHPTENPEKWTYLQLQECAKEAAAVQGKIEALQLLRDELRAGLGLE